MEFFESGNLILLMCGKIGSSLSCTFMFSSMSQGRKLLYHCFMVTGSMGSDLGVALSRPSDLLCSVHGVGWQRRLRRGANPELTQTKVLYMAESSQQPPRPFFAQIKYSIWLPAAIQPPRAYFLPILTE